LAYRENTNTVVRITNKTAQTTLTEKFLQRTLDSLLVILLLILTLIALLALLRLLGLLFLRELLGGLQDVEEVTAGLCLPVSILLFVWCMTWYIGPIAVYTYRHGGPGGSKCLSLEVGQIIAHEVTRVSEVGDILRILG
jgi:hypothetical protein